MSRGEIAGRRTKDTDFSSSRRETLECSRVWRSVSPLFSLSLLSVSLNPNLDQSRFPHVTAVHPIGGFRGEIFCFSFDFANRSSSFISCRKRRVKASADQKIIFSRFFSLLSSQSESVSSLCGNHTFAASFEIKTRASTTWNLNLLETNN